MEQIALASGTVRSSGGGRADVVLVSMPFGPLMTPSLGLGLLAAQLRGAGISSDTLYLTIPFAKRIGPELYDVLSAGDPGAHLLLGDWLFRDALFGAAHDGADDRYLALFTDETLRRAHQERLAPWATPAELRADVARIRACIDGFLADSVTEILAREPAVVGFTTVFQQNVASLALARRIKLRSPRTQIVFGGANCESVMGAELLKRFSFIDHVVSGEGDHVVVPLVDAILHGEPVAVPGVFSRGAGGETAPSRPVEDLDALPYPEYAPYFEQLRRIAPELEDATRILYETSRGCWWGERSHCTFCGLNGLTMQFRSKSAERAFDELQWLTASYPGRAVSIVDNILDHKYFESFIPMLKSSALGAELFYEVKANLRKAQVRQLRDANVLMIQPGIESLSDSVLRLMRKGVSALQNVQLLKWCVEIGVTANWNLIWGFPGEDPQEYAAMARLIPLIRHLIPPGACSPIRLDRFSPNFDEADSRGIRNVRPFAAYDFVYDALPPSARHNVAYYFDFEYDDRRNVAQYTAVLSAELLRWQADADKVAFFWIGVDDKVLLCDLRDESSCRLTLLDPLDAALYRICDTGRTAEEAHRVLNDPRVPLDQVAFRLSELARAGTMVFLTSRFLSLAVDFIACVPPAVALERFQAHLATQDQSSDDDVMSIAVAGLFSERSTNSLIPA
jgi:ribosomal peptide maturation radical SAM protein 1